MVVAVWAVFITGICVGYKTGYVVSCILTSPQTRRCLCGSTSCTSCTQTSADSHSVLPQKHTFLRPRRTMSNDCIKGWLSCSWWHSAQSNHFRPNHPLISTWAHQHRILEHKQHGDRIATWAFRMCLLETTRWSVYRSGLPIVGRYAGEIARRGGGLLRGGGLFFFFVFDTHHIMGKSCTPKRQ